MALVSYSTSLPDIRATWKQTQLRHTESTCARVPYIICAVLKLIHVLVEAKCSQIVSEKAAPMILLYDRVHASRVVTRRDVGGACFFRFHFLSYNSPISRFCPSDDASYGERSSTDRNVHVRATLDPSSFNTIYWAVLKKGAQNLRKNSGAQACAP